MIITATYYPIAPDTWESVSQHPQQLRMVRGEGPDAATAREAFATAWHQQVNAGDEFVYLLSAQVRAQLRRTPDGWVAYAAVDSDTEVEIIGDNRPEVEASFCTAWNTAAGTNHDFDAFAFDRVG